MTHAPSSAEFDPNAPFIAQDGFEYQDVAAYILGCPANCWRNTTVRQIRALSGEKAVREWLQLYDGGDPTPSVVIDAEKARRQAHAESQIASFLAL